MKKTIPVIVYGHSLNMAGIAASLSAEPNLEIICNEGCIPDLLAGLNRREPATLIFDLADPPSELDLVLLRDRPNLLLIGVDVSSDEVLVLSGQLHKVISGRELAEIVIKDEAHPKVFSQIRKIITGGEFDQNQKDVDEDE